MPSVSEFKLIYAERAKAIQSKLSAFPPLPPDPINDRFYKTLSLHSIRVPDEQVHNPPEHRPPEGCPHVSFSIGYDQKSIAAAVDSLDLFESETIPSEIASFARTRVKISSFDHFTEYSDGLVTKRIKNYEPCRDSYVEVLNSFPLLTTLTCLTSLMKSIHRANGGGVLESVEAWDDVVNYSWMGYFSWSITQEVFYEFWYWDGSIKDCIGSMFESWGSVEQVCKLRSLHENCEFSDLIVMQKMADSNIEMRYGESLAEFWIRKLSLRKRKLSSDDEPESKKKKTE